MLFIPQYVIFSFMLENKLQLQRLNGQMYNPHLGLFNKH